ncbi:MAG: ABC transporter ATP-binding protein [Salinivirgaceae bacterium]|jgi:ABC-type multidrug transport system ATPase subunit|nr:ABC transporter ATP-binding protein [Salinivirgaceae bacterium]
MQNIIETHDLTFHFRGKKNAVTGLNLNVPQGSIYGFLGPNGAGKTTTIRMLAGLLFPKRGIVKMFGNNISTHKRYARSHSSTMIEEPTAYKHLTGRENLEILCKAGMFDKTQIDQVLRTVNLFEDRHRKVSGYSMGMKQRLGIAGALLPNPELFILDEPTNGLDPQGMFEIRELIVDLNKKEGKTIFISSHLLGEIEKMCTHVGIIHQGKGIFEGSMDELALMAHATKLFRLETSEPQKAESILKDRYNTKLTHDKLVEIQPADSTDQYNAIKMLINQNIEVYQAFTIKNNLEELFIQVTDEGQNK